MVCYFEGDSFSPLHIGQNKNGFGTVLKKYFEKFENCLIAQHNNDEGGMQGWFTMKTVMKFRMMICFGMKR